MKKTMVISIVLAMLQFMTSCTQEGASLGVALLVGNDGEDRESIFDPNCSGLTSRDTLYISEAARNYFLFENTPTLTLKNEDGQELDLKHNGVSKTTSILNLEIFCRNADYHIEQTYTHAQKMTYYFEGELPSGEVVSVRCVMRKSKEEIGVEEYAYYEFLEATLNTSEAYNTYLDIPTVSEFTWYDETTLGGTEEISRKEEGTFVESMELNGQIFENVRYIVNSQNYGIYINPEHGIIAIQTAREALFVVI